jgi:hypothetical protein
MDKVNQVQYMLRLLINLTGPKRQSILSFSQSQITVLFKGFLDVERIIDDEVKVMGGKRDGVEKWIDVQSLILVLLINICGKEGSDGPLLIANYGNSSKSLSSISNKNHSIFRAQRQDWFGMDGIYI